MKKFVAVPFVIAVWVSTVWSDDMRTLSGQVYSNIVVQQYNQEGYFILHDGGRTNVPFKEIMPELRGHYKALSVIPISRARMGGEKEAPAGPADLETRAGKIYRNVTVRKIEEDRVLISHDTGLDTVYFSALSDPMQKRARTEFPVVADPPLGPHDILTTYGLIFRNTEILFDEPDGLTFRHDGGVTKLAFPALPEKLGEQYHFNPEAAWKYSREVAAKRRESLEKPAEEKPNGPPTFSVYAVETQTLPDNKFWVRFSVTNLTDQVQTIQAVPCKEKLIPMVAEKTITLPAFSVKDLQQFVVPITAPSILKLSTDTYRTNHVLTWE